MHIVSDIVENEYFERDWGRGRSGSERERSSLEDFSIVSGSESEELRSGSYVCLEGLKRENIVDLDGRVGGCIK